MKALFVILAPPQLFADRILPAAEDHFNVVIIEQRFDRAFHDSAGSVIPAKASIAIFIMFYNSFIKDCGLQFSIENMFWQTTKGPPLSGSPDAHVAARGSIRLFSFRLPS
jgi:hypothetical protein